MFSFQRKVPPIASLAFIHICRNPSQMLIRCTKSNFFYSSDSLVQTSKHLSSSSAENDADVFGTLTKSLELSSRKVRSSNPSKINKDAKIIKIKRQKTIFRKEANIFGNLSDSNSTWYPEPNENFKKENDLSDDSVIVKNISRKYRCPKLYLSRMKELVKDRKLKEALDLFVDMKKNYVTPAHAHFTFMIGACGRAGYTEMAFTLLRQMTDRKLRPTPATLTGLFNSCAESPFPEFGLKKANFLKEKLKTKNWNLTQLTYHAMIKAFGLCGDIASAFEVVDEMMKNDIKVNAETYSFLFMSCIADKEAGFTHAIEVWRKMKAKRCKPNLFSYNLLLRAARDCGIGPDEVSYLLIQHWSNYLKRPYGFKSLELPNEKDIHKTIPAAQIVNLDESNIPIHSSSSKEKNDAINDHINGIDHDVIAGGEQRVMEYKKSAAMSIIDERPQFGSEVVDLVNIKTPSDRLSLLGGPQGVLKDLSKAKLRPSIKTFTLLLECLPNDTQAEEELLLSMESYDVSPDTGFCNVLIKRRSFRYDYMSAREAFLLVNKWNLTPDIITFGVLALGCTTLKKATSFLKDMEKLGFHPNIEIIGSLTRNACQAINLEYMQSILQFMNNESILPNEKILKKLENTMTTIKQNVIDMEHGKDVPNVYKEKEFSNKFKDFTCFYEEWLKIVNVEEEKHVWKQYKTDVFGREKVID